MSSTDPSDPSDGPRRAPGPASGRPPPSPSSLAATLTDVSALIGRLQALNDSYLLEGELRGELSRSVAQLEVLTQRLLRTPVHTPPVHPPATAVTPALPREADLEAAFLDWLASTTRPDLVRLGEVDQRDFPLSTILGALSTSTTPLPPDAAAILGSPNGTTIGAAAADLILAVNDPAGPRCRSYRAAIYFLAEQGHIDLIAADLEAALR